MRDLTPERLTRLLAMIAYFADGREVEASVAAKHFGISTEQLMRDIDTLWLSGAPGYGHAELIDFEATALDAGIIQLRDAQQMEEPLRLAPGEAVSLLVALNSLIARLGESEVLESTRSKLMIAAGEAAHAADAVLIERTPSDTHGLREQIQAAITSHHLLAMTYVSGRDQVTERVVEPELLLATGDHWVVHAWCHRAQARRQFRLDRVIKLETLPTTFTPRSKPDAFGDLDTSNFGHRITLRLSNSARWILDQIPVEAITEEGETFTIEVASAYTSWLERLCLRLGDALHEVTPANIAAAVSARAQSALSLYDE